MTRRPWSFAGYQWPINPTTDTGWLYEYGIIELNPITTTSTLPQPVHQRISRRAAKRQITGYIFGPRASEFYQQLLQWYQNHTRALLVDHLNESKLCFIRSMTTNAVYDYKTATTTTPTYAYTIEFVSVV